MKRKLQPVKILNIVFIALVVIFLFVGLLRALFVPKDVNYYENRPANKLPAFTPDSWFEGTFQENVEASLNDQIPFAQHMKKLYKTVESTIKLKSLIALSGYSSAPYFNYGGFKVYGSKYLAYRLLTKENVYPLFDKKTELINRTVKAHPEIGFYMYYIEKDTDIDFESGERLEAYEYLTSRLLIAEKNTSCFSVRSLEDYEEYFYQTDHHWNYKGSYRGYTEVVRLLFGESEPVLMPVSEKNIGTISGSKARSAGAEGVFREVFSAYRFDFPEYQIEINGEKADDYGDQERYLSSDGSTDVSYGSFYGPDSSRIVFDTKNSSKPNILVLGESYDNALLKLLASHFNKTYSVDLRGYTLDYGSFDLGDFLEKNEIDTVLFIGNVDFFRSDAFVWED